MNTYSTEDKNFDKDVINSSLPTLVDFWAEWCGPCKQIAPILDEIAREKKDKIKIVKLNIDENPQTPQKYGVRGIPTLMFFKNGKLFDSKVGSMPKTSLDNWIESCLD
tara:strand:+ start:37 stop:360 length:324 start_codon:yes stop_codon:yes gene_type:complete